MADTTTTPPPAGVPPAPTPPTPAGASPASPVASASSVTTLAELKDIAAFIVGVFAGGRYMGIMSRMYTFAADKADQWSAAMNTIYHTTFVVAARSILWRVLAVCCMSLAGVAALVYFSHCQPCDVPLRALYAARFHGWAWWYGLVPILVLFALPIRYLWRSRRIREVSFSDIEELDRRHEIVRTDSEEEREVKRVAHANDLRLLAGGRLDLSPMPAFTMSVWVTMLVGLLEICWAISLARNSMGVQKPYTLAMLMIAGSTVAAGYIAYLANVTLFMGGAASIGNFATNVATTVYHGIGSVAPILTMAKAREQLGVFSAQFLKDAERYAKAIPHRLMVAGGILWILLMAKTHVVFALLVLFSFVLSFVGDFAETSVGLDIKEKERKRIQRTVWIMGVFSFLVLVPFADIAFDGILSRVGSAVISAINSTLAPPALHMRRGGWQDVAQYVPIFVLVSAVLGFRFLWKMALPADHKKWQRNGRWLLLGASALGICAASLGLVGWLRGRPVLALGDVFAPPVCRLAPPLVPGRVKARITPDPLRAIIEWDDISNETGYRVERRNGLDRFRMVSLLEPDVRGYEDPGVRYGETYEYRVVALRGEGVESAPSQIVRVTLPPQPSFHDRVTSTAQAIRQTTDSLRAGYQIVRPLSVTSSSDQSSSVPSPATSSTSGADTASSSTRSRRRGSNTARPPYPCSDMGNPRDPHDPFRRIAIEAGTCDPLR